MHAILDLKSNGSVTKDYETREERLSKTCTSGLLVHDNWAELLVDADENDLFAAENERDHALYDDKWGQ